MYEKAQGVKQDFKKALELYEKSCRGGDQLGCNNLGALKAHISKDSKDRQSVVEGVFQACFAGEFLSCGNLGMAFFEQNDIDSAIKYLSKACILGEKDKNVKLNPELEEL